MSNRGYKRRCREAFWLFLVLYPLFQRESLIPYPTLELSPMLTDAECKNATCPPDKARARLACSGGLYLDRPIVSIACEAV